MSVGKIFNHVAHDCVKTMHDIKVDLKKRIENFQSASTEEKTLVLLKTFGVAVACGIIVLAGTALLGVPGAAPVLAAIVVGGAVAFYRFAGSAKGEFGELVDQGIYAVQESLNGLDDDAQAVTYEIRNAADQAVRSGKKAAKNLTGAVFGKPNKNNQKTQKTSYNFKS